MDEEFVQLVSNTGMVTFKELRKASMSSAKDSAIPEFSLLSLENFDDHKFALQMAEKYNIDYINLDEIKIPSNALSALQKKIVNKFQVLPIEDKGNSITVVSFTPLAKRNLSALNDIVRKNIKFALCDLSKWEFNYRRVKASVDELVNTVKEIDTNVNQEIVSQDEISDDIVTFVNRILADAFIKGASDIHIEVYEKKFRVRFRIDGILHETAAPPKAMALAMVSRIKVLAKMDISEKRKPQDGRIKLSIGNKPIDYRVSSLPTLFGEKIVLRLLDSSNLQLDMTKLGFMKRQLGVFKSNIHRPFGMCLVTGPTGSGKTTTLYSALAELNEPNTNISTAEDPCEFNLEGINQVNVRKDIGLTFAAALKSFLRQDPDIIMVGEIRDLEVGEIAVEAALTGHLVLSTLHTNDAASTITRLLNMGIEPFLVVAALNVVVAQRLCKRICSSCKEEIPNQTKELVSCGMLEEYAKQIRVFKGRGCEECGGTGYKGRVAIHEVLAMNSEVRELVLSNASADEIKKSAIKSGMRTLRMSALIKVCQGLTTLEEAVSNSAADAA